MIRVRSYIAFLCVALYGPGSVIAQEVPDDDESTATARALEELSAAYESLAGLIGQGSDEAVDRVQEDIENLGDWEYRIITLESASPELVAAELNTLGDERWEVFWVESSQNEMRFYLKRPAVSYLSRVPLSTLLRALSGVGQ